VEFHRLPDRIMVRLPEHYRLIARWTEFAEIEEVLALDFKCLCSAARGPGGSFFVPLAGGGEVGPIPGDLYKQSRNYMHNSNILRAPQIQYNNLPQAIVWLVFVDRFRGLFMPVTCGNFIQAIVDALVS
jgi:hypothetical protein